ncbi:MAG: UvrD-helicase domain-containing protein [Planctomycetes bacterium]|nr:UvrD-helicase domain-containing protein [Planctomycetota bacterium]
MVASDLLSELTPPQRDAVAHTEGPLLVLAGAGSGKTRVITRRAAYIARTVARPSEVLAITFTNKAAGEMKDRITALGVGGRMWVCTFHSLCARLLREFGDLAGIEGNFSIFDTSDSRSAVAEAVKECGLHAENWRPAGVLASISDIKTQLLLPEEYATRAASFEEKTHARIYEAYQALLRKQNAVDFDDLLMLVARLLDDNAELRAELSRRFRYLLIDEYQDTNHAQYVIATRLGETHQNICATGDPDQSIYAWRGADIQNILDFEADYPDAAVVRLEQNFRSTGAILSAASALISHNEHRKKKDLWTDGDRGESVRVWACEDERHEAQRIVEDVQAFCGEGGTPGDVAIFYRVNALSRILEDAFRRTNIAYQIARGVEFYARKEIKDVLSYLRVIVNPADETALLRAINMPPRGIGKVTLDRLQSLAGRGGFTLYEAILRAGQDDNFKAAKKKLAVFAELLIELRKIQRSPVQPLMNELLKRTGIEAALHDPSDPDNERLENVEELVSAARQFDMDNPGGTLEEWLHQISLVSDTDRMAMNGGAVTFMTLHAAKGLEFPVVYMVGVEEGLLPHSRAARESDLEVEEERRLAFVGITRAMHRLTLSHVRYRTVRGISERAMVSRFIDELPEDEIVMEKYEVERDRSRSHLGRFNAREFEMEDSTYYPGCRVKHEDYGEGQVIGLESRLRSKYIRIHFREFGERSFALEHVSLIVMDE